MSFPKESTMRFDTEYSAIGWTAYVKVTYDKAGDYFDHEFLYFSPCVGNGALKRVQDPDVFDEIAEYFDNDSGFNDHLSDFEAECREELESGSDD